MIITREMLEMDYEATRRRISELRKAWFEAKDQTTKEKIEFQLDETHAIQRELIKKLDHADLPY